MTIRLSIILLVLMAAAGLQLGTAQTPPTLDERVAALETRVSALEGTQVPPATLTPTTAPATATAASTATPEPPTATAVPSSTPIPLTATPSPPPTSTPAVAAGWHPAGSHDGLNVHEHGIVAPPAWVLASGHPAFSQTRESHTGYKGAYDVSPGGVQSYFIGHIVSTEFARGHGDHDYELWLRDPETGAVAYYTGVLNFGNPGLTDPIPERTSDTGERPIALSVNDGGCETWYNRPGYSIIDIGWTICGRYQSFDGTVRGGVGTFRTVDWIVYCSDLPAGSPMLDNCRVEFGASRISFLVNSVENDPAHIVRPIN